MHLRSQYTMYRVINLPFSPTRCNGNATERQRSTNRLLLPSIHLWPYYSPLTSQILIFAIFSFLSFQATARKCLVHASQRKCKRSHGAANNTNGRSQSGPFKRCNTGLVWITWTGAKLPAWWPTMCPATIFLTGKSLWLSFPRLFSFRFVYFSQ